MVRNHEPRRLRVVVVGQKYVELPLAVRAAEIGRHTVGLDVDAARIKRRMLGESHVEDAARTLGHQLTRGATVVLESTMYAGTTEEVFRPILERSSGLTADRDFHLGYRPERIDPGNPTRRLENPKGQAETFDAGAGVKRMKPNGSVDAALMAAQTSRPRS
ncbi:hypothetical protein [Streptomyces sp. NBC_01217]|uniref:hypothetical protein n=1 Tax=Streptomyces sp. NBC_01217 TaxID=2903779 RepID=UPI003FA3D42E